MKIKRAVITAAGREQRTLPLQTLVDRDGQKKSVLSIIVEETLRAGIEEICIIVQPGDEIPYAQVTGNHSGRLSFVQQNEPLGYGHAVYCASEFIGNNPFLHMVADHLHVSRTKESCAQKLIQVAESEECTVSAVQATRENQLLFYGTVGGRRVPGRQDLYQVETVIEKPTPTEAEQRLIVPGLRAGHYLCFFGMHVLTPLIFDILKDQISKTDSPSGITLSDALAELAKREQYLAFEHPGWRYDIGSKYGLLTAQLAIALNGQDRNTILSMLLEILALRELGKTEYDK